MGAGPLPASSGRAVDASARLGGVGPLARLGDLGHLLELGLGLGLDGVGEEVGEVLEEVEEGGQAEAAAEVLEKVAANWPKDADTLYNLGSQLMNLRSLDSAADLLKLAIDAAPDHVHAMINFTKNGVVTVQVRAVSQRDVELT